MEIPYIYILFVAIVIILSMMLCKSRVEYAYLIKKINKLTLTQGM